ncbi:MAG: M12 family metallo-peptidase [Bacteroidota bacterium]
MKQSALFLVLVLLFSTCKKDKDATGNNSTVGESANMILSSTVFDQLDIQIQYMPGYRPDDASVANLVNMVKAYCNKPAGVNYSLTQIGASGKSSISLNDVKTLEKDNRTAFNNNKTFCIHILITDAPYSEPNVLGIAYKNSSLCLFGKTIFDNSGGFGQTSRIKLESVVLNHELGHLLGLVDVGTPMQTSHIDADHGRHCNNSNCLMYYTSETTDVLGAILTGNIPDLDVNCKNDLKANGGK